MDLFEAIRSRRSIGKVKPDPVERHLIERIIEAGTWAPNHKNTEPWRFFVQWSRQLDYHNDSIYLEALQLRRA